MEPIPVKDPADRFAARQEIGCRWLLFGCLSFPCYCFLLFGGPIGRSSPVPSKIPLIAEPLRRKSVALGLLCVAF